MATSSAEVDGRRRVVIEGVQPEVDAGLFPAKRVVGDTVVVEADIFADSHDVLSAVVLYRHASEKKFREVRMIPMPNDRWRAELTVDQLGYTIYTIEAWVDQDRKSTRLNSSHSSISYAVFCLKKKKKKQKIPRN